MKNIRRSACTASCHVWKLPNFHVLNGTQSVTHKVKMVM